MTKPVQQSSSDQKDKCDARLAGTAEDLLEQQDKAWATAERKSIEELLKELNPAEDRDGVLLDLICNEIALREQAGEKPTLAEYQQRFPLLSKPLQLQWEINILLCSGHARVTDDIGQSVEDIAKNSDREDASWTDSAKPHEHAPTNESGSSAVVRTFDVPQSQQTLSDELFSKSITNRVGKHKRIGHYRLEAQLGRGGMGVVYLAVDLKLDRIVALKCIRNLDFATDGVKSRFEREALAVARLSHRNIVTIYDYGRDDDVPFIAMEYVEGTTLAEMLRLNEKMSPSEAVILLRQIAAAVGYAHDNGIIHRDLKPANILVDKEGVPRIADFGLARAELDCASLTVSGDILGTPSYMSPEQAAGRVDSVGRPSDVYSLGAILYECLTGVPPFRAENSQLTLMQVIENSVVLPRKYRPEVPRDTEIVCMKCLAKLPEHRYANAHELVADLDRLINDQPIHNRAWTVQERTQSFIRNNVVFVSVAAALIATLPIFFLNTPLSTSDASVDNLHSTEITYLTTLIESNPSNAVPWLRRAEHRYLAGEFEFAKDDAITAEKLGIPQTQQAHLILGKCQLQLGNYAKSEAEFIITVKLDPYSSEAWLGLGEAHLKIGQSNKAIEDLTRAIALQPENRKAYQLRAAACELAGNIDQAKSDRSVFTKLLGSPRSDR